jgi:hypothetical protein
MFVRKCTRCAFMAVGTTFNVVVVVVVVVVIIIIIIIIN